MADNISQAQHITELDFDLTKALNDLKQIENEVEETAKRIATIDFRVGDVISDSGEYEKAHKQLETLTAEKIQQEKKVQAEKNKLSKESERALNKAYTLNEKLYSLAQKGKNMSDKSYVGEQKKVKQLQEQSDELLKQLKLSNSLTDEQKQQLDLLAKQTREQENIYKKASTRQGSAVKSSLLDDAKRYISYKAVDLGVTAVREGFQEVRDVETRMMEIARVMNLTSEQTVEMRNNLYALGKEYGRSFEEVSDIALRFTQAGYEANDVMSMTRAMLLGINTAELEAESGTVALIGIMQQWEYEASQLTTIIDKLNYTADNNAITTQDLTDALLNASSVAKIAGMSFEDTMGVLVAMKEASGRTGKEVGNAFKSILSYIQRESSLNIFEQAGIDVYVNETTKELRPMMDILSDMAVRWGSMGDEAVDALVKSADEAQLFSEEMAAVMGVEKEYEQALRDVNDAETRGVTSAAAGVFRRNYYIALMEKFAKVSQVSAEAIDTEGYSLRENERYMETTDAKIKQLTSSLSELAVAFADAGALDLAKEFLDSATAITEFAKQAGGLESAMLTLLGVFLMLKGQKIAEGITEIEDAANSMFEVFETGAITTQSAFGLIGLSISAIAVLFSAIDYAAKAGQRAIEDFTKSTQEYANTKSELEKVKLELDAIAKSIEEIQGKGELDFTDETQLEKLRQQRQELEHQQKLLEIQEKQLAKQNAETAIVAYETNQQSFTINGGDSRTNLLTEYQNKIEKYEAEREVLLRDIENAKRNNESEEIISALEYDYQSANELVEHYKGLVVDEEGYIASAVMDIEQYMIALEQAGMQGTDTYRQMELQKIALDNALKQDNTPAINSYEDYRKAVEKGQISTDNFKKSTEESTKATEENADALTEQANAITVTAENLSDYSSRISTLNGYLDKLSKGQKLSADEALKLIELYPELARQIQVTSDGFYIETEALNGLNKTQIDAVATFKLSQAELSNVLSEETLKRLANYETEMTAIKTIADLQSAVAGVGGVDTNTYGVNSKEDADRLGWIKAVQQANSEYEEQKKKLEDILGQTGSSFDTTNSSLKETTSILDVLLKDFNELDGRGVLDITEKIEYLNYVLKDTRLTTEDVTTVQNQLYGLYKQQITDLINAEEEASQKRQDAIKDRYNKEIEYAKESNKAQIDATKARYDAEIEALREYKNELSQDRKEEDYYEKRNELLEERSYYEQRTGREAVEKIEDIDKQIADLDKNYARSLEDAEIDAQIALLQNKRDNEVAYQEQLYNDRVAQLEAELEAEVAKEQQKYEKFKAQFTEANIAMIASAGVYDNQLYQQFVKYFSNPMMQDLSVLLSLFAQLATMKEQVIGGTDLAGNINISTSNTTPKIPQAATGGLTLGNGLMFLHENEFIANADLTAKLDKFLSSGYGVNPFYLQNPLSNSSGGGNSYNNNNSRNITIEKGAIQVNSTVNDAADATTTANAVTREIMNKISRML